MKVYIITKEPFPNGMAATNRIKCYARAIHDGGVDCEVLIYGGTELKGKIVRNKESSGNYASIPYKYVGGSPIVSTNGILRRISQFWRRILVDLYLLKNFRKGDVMFFYMGGDVKTTLHFIHIARFKGGYCIRDLCEYPYGTGAETDQAIHFRNLTLEKQFPKLDGFICISDTLMDLAKTHSRPNCKQIKVPIMVEYEHYVVEEKKYQDVPYIFHAGTLLQQKDGILGMIDAFGKAKLRIKQHIKYILTGCIEQSSHPKQLKQLIEKYDLQESVEFVGYLNRDQIKEYLSRATLVISNRPKTKQDFYGFSTKVGEYLASGTPLITTNWGEAVNWLKDGKSAYIVEPENTEALADAIVRVFCNQEEAKQIGLNGQKLCRDCFDYHNWIKPIVDFLNQLGV